MAVDRVRKIDIEQVDEEAFKNIQDGIIKKITEINDEAVEKANKILKIYGLEAKMQFLLKKKEDK